MKVNILGTEYTVIHRKESEDAKLEGNDGYCDSSTKTIVILEWEDDVMNKGNMKTFEKQVLRHEITHAFLSESGLEASAGKPRGSWAHNEEMVDWFAIQSPKMIKAFEEAGAL
jgi:hypothetical protein